MRASDYFKYYETIGTTAVAADILVGEIGYIEGGRVIGQGIAPSGSATAFYRTQDATITSNMVTAWKTAYGKLGLILGTYYPGAIPATGSIFSTEPLETLLYDPIDDIFDVG